MDQPVQDTSIAWKLAAMIGSALIIVFALQRLGFYFVVGAGTR